MQGSVGRLREREKAKGNRKGRVKEEGNLTGRVSVQREEEKGKDMEGLTREKEGRRGEDVKECATGVVKRVIERLKARRNRNRRMPTQ